VFLVEKEDWIKEIYRFYRSNKADLSSYSSTASDGRIEGQFGRQVYVKGYEDVIVYLQLSPSIDFDKVKQFLKFHLQIYVLAL